MACLAWVHTRYVYQIHERGGILLQTRYLGGNNSVAPSVLEPANTAHGVLT